MSIQMNSFNTEKPTARRRLSPQMTSYLMDGLLSKKTRGRSRLDGKSDSSSADKNSSPIRRPLLRYGKRSFSCDDMIIAEQTQRREERRISSISTGARPRRRSCPEKLTAATETKQAPQQPEVITPPIICMHKENQQFWTSKKAITICSLLTIAVISRRFLFLHGISIVVVHQILCFCSKWAAHFADEAEEVASKTLTQRAISKLFLEGEKLVNGDKKRLAIAGYLLFAEGESAIPLVLRQLSQQANRSVIEQTCARSSSYQTRNPQS